MKQKVIKYNVPTSNEMNEIMGMLPLVEKQLKRSFKVYEDGRFAGILLQFSSGLTLHHHYKSNS